MANTLGCCLLQLMSIQSDYYVIVNNLAISLVLTTFRSEKNVWGGE